jgi:hypothetical protein
MGAPSAVCWSRGRVDVFYAGDNYYLTHRWQDDGQPWSGEEVLFRGEGGDGSAAVSWGCACRKCHPGR